MSSYTEREDPGALMSVPAGKAAETPLRAFLVRVKNIPLWVVILAVVGLLLTYSMLESEVYRHTIRFLSVGVVVTLQLTIFGFALAMVFGFVAGLGGLSHNPIINTIATVYVELGRGLPLLVQILYVGYVIAPAVSQFLHTGAIGYEWRAIVALAFCSGAYQAEVFRAGIQAIERGQMDAARSLGMTYVQAMRYIIMPQAMRIILPPLGNNFIAILKDSSLASALGVTDVTQLARVNAARTLDFFTTWNTALLLYLAMTISLSLGVQSLEKRFGKGK